MGDELHSDRRAEGGHGDRADRRDHTEPGTVGIGTHESAAIGEHEDEGEQNGRDEPVEE